MILINWSDVYKSLVEKFPKDKDLWLDHYTCKVNNNKGNYKIISPSRAYIDRFKDKYYPFILNKLGVFDSTQLVFEYSIETYDTSNIQSDSIKIKKNKSLNHIGKDLKLSTTNLLNDSFKSMSIKEKFDNVNLLNPSYTFESLIEGENNQLAYIAAKRIASTHKQEYNPLLIYGGVGLGKTHIMQSIGNYIKKVSPYRTVLYVTSEQFMNEYVYYLKSNSAHSFRLKYRYVDVLLLDDIQFLENKHKIQEEIFHTFNILKESGKQMVFTSDRHPNQLSNIKDRLISRFASGLVCDVKMPEVDSRISILEKKFKLHNIHIEKEIVEHLANKLSCSIRMLESCVLKIKSISDLLGKSVTVQTVDTYLSDVISKYDIYSVSNTVTKSISINDIESIVSDYYHISNNDIRSKKRTALVAKARKVLIFLSKQYTSLSNKQIGSFIGGRNYSTIICAYNSFVSKSKVDKALKYDADYLEDKIMHSTS